MQTKNESAKKPLKIEWGQNCQSPTVMPVMLWSDEKLWNAKNDIQEEKKNRRHSIKWQIFIIYFFLSVCNVTQSAHTVCVSERERERQSVWVTSQDWWSNLCALLCWCPGSRVCVFSPCWSRTAPVMSSSTTACPGCARCSRSYRYGALDSLSNFFSFKCKIKKKYIFFSFLFLRDSLLSVVISPLAVSGSSADRPARSEHSEGRPAVFVPAPRARQGGRLELHSGYPHVSAWP